MKTSVERVDDTTVKLSVTVEPERVTEAVDEAARRLASEVRIPGFRPGRAPKRVLESRLGKDAIAQEAARDALPRFYSEAAQAEELSVVGPPEIELDTFEDGKEAVFSATVEVRPEIELPDYEELQVPHPDWELTDEEVDEQLEALRERFASLETVSRPAQQGDHVLISISGTQGGQPVPEVAADDTLHEISDPEESDSELDRNLLGAQPGAILKFTDTLGPGYGERAGQQVQLTAIVKEVKAKRLPDLDDAFAADASEFDTIDELRTELRAHLAREKRAQAEQALRGRVVEAVAELVDVPLPTSMVQTEVRFLLDRVAQQAEQYGMSVEQFLQAAGVSNEQMLEQFEAEAEQAVKAHLVLDAVARDAELEIERNDLRGEVALQAARMGRDPSELAEFMSQPERVGALVSDALRRKAIDHLLEKVQVLSGPPEHKPRDAKAEDRSQDDPQPVDDADDGEG
ncbi:MAG TPA: trigger factor [Egibacteraceae bacterium]|nr:trigger factor [Egibacteraceae bacterium]